MSDALNHDAGPGGASAAGTAGTVTTGQGNSSTSAPKKQPHTPKDAGELASAAIRALLNGSPPNGTAPADCGAWADVVQALYDAHSQGGTPAARKAFDALAHADAHLAALVASGPTPSQLTPHDVPNGKVLDALGRGETGDAELLEALYSGLIAYDHAESTWYLWAGHYWQPDRRGAVYRLVTNRVAARYLGAAAEARQKGDDELEGKLTARAGALRNRRRVENVLFLGARQLGLAVAGDEWDKEPWLLAVANGVVDLRTGQLGAGRPADYLRSAAPTAWAGLDAPAPQWEAFLRGVFASDTDLIAFMGRLLGYGLTGLTREHVLPILYGEGRNGKGTALETLKTTLGRDLVLPTLSDALMENQRGGDGPQPYVYAMRGKRLVWASESKEGRRIDAGLVKLLTGGDTLNPRTIYGKPTMFDPTHLLLLLTNHKPHIAADDQAVWDRVLLVPFTQRFVDEPGPGEHKRDPVLGEKLQQEAPAILAWLVRGCLEWQRRGLDAPAAVRAATTDYRHEEDTVSQYISECCLTGNDAKGKPYEVRAGDLFADYKLWCIGADVTHISLTAFGKDMRKRYQTDSKTGYVRYLGIGLAAKGATP